MVTHLDRIRIRPEEIVWEATKIDQEKIESANYTVFVFFLVTYTLYNWHNMAYKGVMFPLL